MLKRYIIDSNLEFSPQNFQLTVLDGENLTITLNTPASRCLELLIERRFNLVPQRDFYEYVWGDEGKDISVNTLYQNIALLRKALKTISKKYEVMILTVPKKGFKFNEIFSVLENFVTEVDNYSLTSDISIDSLTSHISHEDTVNGNKTSPWWHRTNKKLKVSLFYALSILVAITILVAFNFVLERKEIYPLFYYTPYADGSTCSIYANANNSMLSRRIQELSELGVDCETTPYLYITMFRYSSRTSAIACRHPLENTSSPFCITYNLIGSNVK
ncbi:winged helix-turn-helix domain-containing protein [Serratia fonticola]|uniref:winged helix-turn-helix domain-containing protein n=1 Tax=Serratia fonticola TaxID=47917 RepID=UPI00209848F0|nr:winged helix-turn-helix domain-containing protein [Serratia fonticola]MCO7509296.1 winged helix-turn-helix domain-containing protein [Serratia fonticola]